MADLAATLIPIDDSAMDGSEQLVFERGQRFALVRWDGERWMFPGGQPLDFLPDCYRPMPKGNRS